VTKGHVCRVAGFAAMALLATGLAACGGEDDDLPPPASPAAAPPSSSTIPPEHQEILDVYYGAVDAMVAAQQAGDPDDPNLTRYFLERTPALLNIQSGIRQNDDRGTYYAGDLIVVNAEVTGIDTDATPPTATIESCVDYTTYQLVYREDDSPVPDVEPQARHPGTWQAILGTDDNWYIATGTTDWDGTC
jgi:hypothetical protein